MDLEEIRRLRWPGDKKRLKAVEDETRGLIRIEPLEGSPRTVCGTDASFSAGKVITVACLLSFPQLEAIEESVVVRECAFPYIPGYLSFREGPPIIEAVERLTTRPDLIIFDGQGTAHPRGVGVAAFAGAFLDIPSIGCAKTRLVGEYREPGEKRGEWSPLSYKGAVVGAAVRTRDHVKPVFVSPGHRIDLDGAVEMVLACAPRRRLTEPVRRADALSKSLKREMKA